MVRPYPGRRNKNNAQQQRPQPPPTPYAPGPPRSSSQPAPIPTPYAPGPAPPLSDLPRWFDVHARNRQLTQDQLVSALVQTFPSTPQAELHQTVFAVWPIFDTDGDGTLNKYEFVRQGGLGESLQAALNEQNQRRQDGYGGLYDTRAGYYNAGLTPAPYNPSGGGGIGEGGGGVQPYVPTAQPIPASSASSSSMPAPFVPTATAYVPGTAAAPTTAAHASSAAGASVFVPPGAAAPAPAAASSGNNSVFVPGQAEAPPAAPPPQNPNYSAAPSSSGDAAAVASMAAMSLSSPNNAAGAGAVAGAGAGAGADPNFWTCPKCTFVNSADGGGRCKACGTAGGPPPRRPQSQQQQQAHVDTLYQPTQPSQPQAQSASSSMPAPYNPHAQPPPPPPQSTQQTYQTMKVRIPPTLSPGQQLRVQLPDGSCPIVPVPPRDSWHDDNDGRGPYFRLRVDVAESQLGLAAAPPPSPKMTRPQAPIVVQGSHVATGGAAAVAAAAASATRRQDFPSWETFRSTRYTPPPLGMTPVPPHEISNGGGTIPTSGRKKALLVGINYKGTRAALRGCINDAVNVKRLLVRHGYPDDSQHIVSLLDEGTGRDRKPTRSNIMKGFQWLLANASPGDSLFFHFSGHGAQVPDATGHEADGYNETIVPCDYQSAGQITDDEIFGSLVYPLPAGVRLMSLMDCCHSGTGMDLPYDFQFSGSRGGRWVEDVNPAHSKGDVVLLSGCEDAQTSADTVDKYQAGGAMTQSFLSAYESHPRTYADLLEAIRKQLRRRGFKQRPQLTSSQPFDAANRPFAFADGTIEANRNRMIGRDKRRHIRPAREGMKQGGAMNDLLFGGAAVVGMAMFADALFG